MGTPRTDTDDAPDHSAELDDAALASRLESEIFRGGAAPRGAVIVNVEDGTVFLRGRVASGWDRDCLITEVGAVDGVRQVRCRLRLPDEPAPPG